MKIRNGPKRTTPRFNSDAVQFASKLSDGAVTSFPEVFTQRLNVGVEFTSIRLAHLKTEWSDFLMHTWVSPLEVWGLLLERLIGRSYSAARIESLLVRHPEKHRQNHDVRRSVSKLRKTKKVQMVLYFVED